MRSVTGNPELDGKVRLLPSRREIEGPVLAAAPQERRPPLPPFGKSESDFGNAKATGIDPVACSVGRAAKPRHPRAGASPRSSPGHPPLAPRAGCSGYAFTSDSRSELPTGGRDSGRFCLRSCGGADRLPHGRRRCWAAAGSCRRRRERRSRTSAPRNRSCDRAGLR